MKLSDKIVASYVEGFSGVYIYCPVDIIEDVAKDFEEAFENAWNTAMDEIEEEYDAVCTEKDEEIGNPASIKILEGRIFVALEPLDLTLNDGARADNEYGPDALEKTLKGLKKKYPGISYEGLIAYEWSDEHAGDVVNYEICSEELPGDNKKTYEFVGEVLRSVIDDEIFSEEFWEKMEWQMEDADEDDFKLVLRDFHVYGVSEEAVGKLLELADEFDEEIHGVLEEIVEKWENPDYEGDEDGEDEE